MSNVQINCREFSYVFKAVGKNSWNKKVKIFIKKWFVNIKEKAKFLILIFIKGSFLLEYSLKGH